MDKRIKTEKKELINSRIELFSRMIVALTRINNGESESEVCRELNINNRTFRHILFSNLDMDYKPNTPLNELNGKIPTLSPAEILWCDVMHKHDISHIPSSIDKTINRALNTLDKRLKQVIRMRYWENLTLDECGEVLGVTANRVREIEAKALRKLRGSNTRRYMMLGEEYYAMQRNRSKQAEIQRLNALNEEYKKLNFEFENLKDVSKSKYDSLQKTLQIANKEAYADYIEDLKLSVRTRNCLLRKRIITVADLMKLSYRDLAMIRNMGRISLEEITNIMKEKYNFEFEQ